MAGAVHDRVYWRDLDQLAEYMTAGLEEHKGFVLKQFIVVEKLSTAYRVGPNDLNSPPLLAREEALKLAAAHHPAKDAPEDAEEEWEGDEEWARSAT